MDYADMEIIERSYPSVSIDLDEAVPGLPSGRRTVFVVKTDGVEVLLYNLQGDLLRVSVNHIGGVQPLDTDFCSCKMTGNSRLAAKGKEGCTGELSTRRYVDFGPLMGMLDTGIDLDRIEKQLGGCLGSDESPRPPVRHDKQVDHLSSDNVLATDRDFGGDL